jgi:RHS repeat-associated protein
VSPLTDALGSVLGLTSSSGTIETQYTYDPYGNTTTTGTASANPSQYTGRESDGAGLYYYRARYYSPTYQRFISEDPIGFAGKDTNLYSYVTESPLDQKDPAGHWNPSLPWVIYGQWCGPDWTGGLPFPYNPECNDQYKLPDDAVDTVCEHRYCPNFNRKQNGAVENGGAL